MDTASRIAAESRLHSNGNLKHSTKRAVPIENKSKYAQIRRASNHHQVLKALPTTATRRLMPNPWAGRVTSRTALHSDVAPGSSGSGLLHFAELTDPCSVVQIAVRSAAKDG